jgi:hypothetical protein
MWCSVPLPSSMLCIGSGKWRAGELGSLCLHVAYDLYSEHVTPTG